MTKELYPCPFCGGEGIPFAFSIMEEYGVRCDDCGAQTDDQFDSLEAAIKAWNTRYKRTCKMERFDPYVQGLKCSKCGIKVEPIIDTIDCSPHSPYKFCPNCGSEVVDD